MSIPVALADLDEQLDSFGTTPYLLTVGPDAVPHATSVTVERRGKWLLAGCGRTTGANIRHNKVVALLWPGPASGEHSLIVDGRAYVLGPADAVAAVLIHPTKAILHVNARPREAAEQ